MKKVFLFTEEELENYSLKMYNLCKNREEESKPREMTL